MCPSPTTIGSMGSARTSSGWNRSSVLDLLKTARREWTAAGNDEYLIEKNVGEEGDGAVEFP